MRNTGLGLHEVWDVIIIGSVNLKTECKNPKDGATSIPFNCRIPISSLLPQGGLIKSFVNEQQILDLAGNKVILYFDVLNSFSGGQVISIRGREFGWTFSTPGIDELISGPALKISVLYQGTQVK